MRLRFRRGRGLRRRGIEITPKLQPSKTEDWSARQFNIIQRQGSPPVMFWKKFWLENASGEDGLITLCDSF